MKRVSVVILFLVVVFISMMQVSSFADTSFDVENIDVHVIVEKDHTYYVTETITVDFLEEKHGINRDIDLLFDGEMQSIKKIRTTDGAGMMIPNDYIKEGSNYRIIIGDQDKTLIGKQVYIITYEYHCTSDEDRSKDIFYFDLIDSSWGEEIPSGHYTVVMPETFDADALSFETGSPSNGSNDHISYVIEGNKIIGDLNKVLSAGHEIHIKIELEEGYFNLGFFDTFSNRVYLVIGIWVIMLVLSFTYNKMHKSKSSEVLNPVSSIKEAFNVAEAVYVLKGRIYKKDVEALIVQWVTEGYLTADRCEDQKYFFKQQTVFIKNKEMGDEKQTYEHMLFKSLFHDGEVGQVMTKDLTPSFSKMIKTTCKAVKDKYTELEPLENFKKKRMKSRYIMITSVIFIVTCIPFLNSTKASYGVLAAMVCMYFLVMYIIKKAETYTVFGEKSVYEIKAYEKYLRTNYNRPNKINDEALWLLTSLPYALGFGFKRKWQLRAKEIKINIEISDMRLGRWHF